MNILINQKRLERGVSVKELSIKAGISVSYIYELESGEKMPSILTLCKISKALNVPVTELFKC